MQAPDLGSLTKQQLLRFVGMDDRLGLQVDPVGVLCNSFQSLAIICSLIAPSVLNYGQGSPPAVVSHHFNPGIRRSIKWSHSRGTYQFVCSLFSLGRPPSTGFGMNGMEGCMRDLSVRSP
ncbi:hypothetical protein F2Q70_00039732 [Brassica cretica]|uniref:Uncharacterized protein n=1 Tax=Brassica cretica TaxID=69181 RepID=A0A8S9K6J0_BRACR|nr:hypothetical protein F2Q70_00039732 [Brassica cretica]